MRYLLESEHLYFRRFEPSDAFKLYENHLETALKQWVPNEFYADISAAENAISFFNDCINRNTSPFVLAIESKLDGELIGDIGVMK
ncbi:GNAT family N-acetyltransferase [Gracilibacillus alcaliphilus]|uniref:GNAT family N-acetyltransferase n=1 Tax=Gracilibacillus alcaliphilus TaxID=1401441 RepID=UPI0019577D36|nr:hypothetical protein [Gracilibacillus alcaliphilus]MBM7675593.1 RimJ/RimL family protein N-acetyltransferase [Gracilibacillus alcaliphilus]